MKRGINKKGISTIVATVLIILITVAAVAIIWMAIIPMIKNNLEGSSECLSADLDIDTFSGYTCTDSSKNASTVMVSRGSGKSDVVKVRVIFENKGNTYSAIVNSPDINQGKTYAFNTSFVPEKISVAPIIKAGNSENECGTTAVVATIGNCKFSDIQYQKWVDDSELYELDGGDYSTGPVVCTENQECDDNKECTTGDVRVCTGGVLGTCAGTNKDNNVPCTGGTCQSGNCVPTACTPNCPAANTVACNQPIVDSNCAGCTGTGTMCGSGQTCQSGGCVVDNTIHITGSDTLPYNLNQANKVYVVDYDVSSGVGNGFNVMANNVTLICNPGFSIYGNQGGSSRGVNIYGYNYTTVKDCEIVGFYEGVYTYYSNNTIIKNNIFVPGTSITGSGVHIYFGENNSVIDNTVKIGFERGIFAESTKNLNISNNNITLSSAYHGIALYTVTSGFVYNNTLIGISTSSSAGIFAAAGTINFEQNNVSKFYNGIRLDSFGGGTLRNNYFCGNPGLDVVCNTGYYGTTGTWIPNTNKCANQIGCGFTCAACS